LIGKFSSGAGHLPSTPRKHLPLSSLGLELSPGKYCWEISYIRLVQPTWPSVRPSKQDGDDKLSASVTLVHIDLHYDDVYMALRMAPGGGISSDLCVEAPPDRHWLSREPEYWTTENENGKLRDELISRKELHKPPYTCMMHRRRIYTLQ